jgi:ATPase subunit of ABC transporter with duplicated ATPase domains
MKRYQWEQEQVAKTKSFIARFGSGSRASQAQSREKTLAKMMESGLTEKVVQEKVKSFFFFSFLLFVYVIRHYHWLFLIQEKFHRLV